MFLTLLLVLSALGALASLALQRLPKPFLNLAAVAPATLFVSLLSNLGMVAAMGAVVETHAWVPSLGVELAWTLDGFSLLFALLITGVGTLVTLYACAYFSERSNADRARFVCLIQIFMTAMLGTVLSDNLVSLFVFWELTSLTSFLLIGFEARKPEARRAALQSLLVTAGGGLALLAGILLISATLGTLSLREIALRSGELTSSPLAFPIALLVIVGAFTKSAQFPFHFWLPQAMSAPTPASAYLHSATMVKLGVYVLARFDAVFEQLPIFGDILVVGGLTTMLIAALNALRATGYKAILAHSTVASLGILVMLIGLDGPFATVAMVGFLIGHAFYKAALFFCAGTAIHATGIHELRKLRGLSRHLPVTAGCAVIASLSMAGLPPFMGFIAKEFLFEAQLESSWSVFPVLVAVLVNGIMVAVAAVVSIRPFFRGMSAPSDVKHGETQGLLVGPLVLASLGILFGLFPATLAEAVIQPAATALVGSPVDVSISLWHGLTPMLALSALVVSLGSVLAWKWDSFHRAVHRQSWLAALDANAAYDRLLSSLLGIARGTTAWLQNNDQRRYTLIVVITCVLAGFWGLISSDVAGMDWSFERVVWSHAALALLGVLGALTAAVATSPVRSLIGIGVFGYVCALLFMLNGAPDLALTQFAVETLLLVVLMALLGRVRTEAISTRTRAERLTDAAVATGFACLVFAGLVSMTSLDFDPRLSEFYGERSYIEAFGRNVVNVVIVDFRALDTLGEIAVVCFATLGAWALLRGPRGRSSE